MRVVEGNHGCIRPVPGRLGLEQIRPPGIVGIGLRKLGHHQQLLSGTGPSLFILRLPGQVVVQHLDLPDAVFFHIGIFVNSAFPELVRYGCRLLFAFVYSAHQETAETALRGPAVRCDIHDILHMEMIRQNAVCRPVDSEAVSEKPLNTLFPFEDTVQKMELAVPGK